MPYIADNRTALELEIRVVKCFGRGIRGAERTGQPREEMVVIRLQGFQQAFEARIVLAGRIVLALFASTLDGAR